jgi:hypothetical protein
MQQVLLQQGSQGRLSRQQHPSVLLQLVLALRWYYHLLLLLLLKEGLPLALAAVLALVLLLLLDCLMHQLRRLHLCQAC